jgi:hypothetical protein
MAYHRRPERYQACPHTRYATVWVSGQMRELECIHRPGCRHRWIVIGPLPLAWTIKQQIKHALGRR